MELWSVVVAGGSGSRFGGLKQLEPLFGRRVLDWSVDAVGDSVGSRGVVVVVPQSEAGRSDLPGDILVAGGETRSESVRCGLQALPPSATHVLVHDGARPLAGASMVGRVINALRTADAVVPVVPITDTLRSVTGGSVDRAEFVAVQTPQGFAVATLALAHAAGGKATDDAALVDATGGSVVHVAGDPRNIKITEPADLLLAEALLAAVSGVTVSAEPAPSNEART